jgi:5-formyltetrahydrofolate cyclo-ligase
VATELHDLRRAAGLPGPYLLAEPGTIPVTGHDVLVDFIVTPERVIDCRPGRGLRRRPAIDWADLTDEKIAAIPLLTALRNAD